MTCNEVLVKISPYHDRELPPAEHERITAHLAGCPACCAVRRDLAHLGGLLRLGQAEEAPQDLWDRIEAAARQTPPIRRFETRAWVIRVAAAAAGFALYLAGYGALASPPRDIPHLRGDRPIEAALRETGVAFARSGALAGPAGLLEQRPEARLLRELIEDLKP